MWYKIEKQQSGGQYVYPSSIVTHPCRSTACVRSLGKLPWSDKQRGASSAGSMSTSIVPSSRRGLGQDLKKCTRENQGTHLQRIAYAISPCLEHQINLDLLILGN